MAEKKYIELQKALNVCEMHYQHCLEMHDWSGDTTADNIMRDIETIPTADVVEVVRCKDCDVPHNKWLGCPYLNGLIPPPDFYCAKGTPKERGGEK